MPVNTKAIKRRMRSVNNTKKITKAMEMVSAAKMRRAVEAAVNTRTYAVMARQILDLLGQADPSVFELLRLKPVEKILVVLVSSNRGLCGSYNANMFRKARGLLQHKKGLAYQPLGLEADEKPRDIEPEIHIIGVGKKSADFARKNNYPLIAVFDTFGDRPTFADILPLTRLVREEYIKNSYQKVMVAYTDYKSSLTQEPRLVQLLPVNIRDIETILDRLGKNEPHHDPNGQLDLEEYLIEPDLTEMISVMLPRLVEVQLYQTILESAASEHSARMLAMRNASEAAGDMIRELSLTYNKARQAGITQEISEIVGGAAALG